MYYFPLAGFYGFITIVKMRAYFCQINSLWEQPEAVYASVTRLLESAHPLAESLIVLPELFATGYSFNPAFAEHPVTGPTLEVLATLAGRFRCYVLGGVLAKYPASPKPHNAAILFDPKGQVQARYDKMQLFSYAGESEHVTPGDRTVQTQVGDLILSPFICYDLRFPELFRTAALGGAGVFAVMASWPAERIDHWCALLAARAIENQAYVIGVNRCGDDPHHHYPGRSMIIDPRGNILAQAGDQPCVISADLSRDDLLAYRKDFPVLSDLRRDYIRQES